MLASENPAMRACARENFVRSRSPLNPPFLKKDDRPFFSLSDLEAWWSLCHCVQAFVSTSPIVGWPVARSSQRSKEKSARGVGDTCDGRILHVLPVLHGITDYWKKEEAANDPWKHKTLTFSLNLNKNGSKISGAHELHKDQLDSRRRNEGATHHYKQGILAPWYW